MGKESWMPLDDPEDLEVPFIPPEKERVPQRIPLQEPPPSIEPPTEEDPSKKPHMDDSQTKEASGKNKNGFVINGPDKRAWNMEDDRIDNKIKSDDDM